MRIDLQWANVNINNKSNDSTKDTNEINSTNTSNTHQNTFSSNNSINPKQQLQNSNNTSQNPYSSKQQQQSDNNNNNYIIIGSVSVSKSTEWKGLEDQLSATFNKHISQVSVGIRSSKISKLEQHLSSPSSSSSSFSSPLSETTPNPFTLGISIKSVKYYTIGE